MSEEQRRGTRLKDPPVDVTGGLNTVNDLSLGGMCILCVESPIVGQKRRFDLVDRRTGKSCTLWGEVRWVEPVAKDLSRVGIQWIDLDAKGSDWLSLQMAAGEKGQAPTPGGSKDQPQPIRWL
jgi:hypothetical protein